MKLKAFGLVEAIIATAVLLLFVTGMFYLSAKAAYRLGYYKRASAAMTQAKEYFSQVEAMSKSEKIALEGNRSDKVALECLNTEKIFECMGAIGKGMEPYYKLGDLVEAKKDSDFLSVKGIDKDLSGLTYSMKASAEKKNRNQFQVDIEIKWNFRGKVEKLILSKIY